MRDRLSWLAWFLLGAALAAAGAWLVYQIPWVNYRLGWRLDMTQGVIRGWIYPGDTLPAPSDGVVDVSIPTALPSRTPRPNLTAQAGPTLTPTAVPTPIPSSVVLDPPQWEKQDWNNCGPATLAEGLRYYGWQGDQFDISDLLKPDRGDKNVNVEELIYYVKTRAGWLNADYRVGGTLDTLKRFIAAGFPIIIEKGLVLAPNDGGGGWAGHYLLLTGYDDAEGVFIGQDTNPISGGANRRVSYATVDQGWQAFNRVYMYVYLPDQQAQIDALLGSDMDVDQNRQNALDQAQAEIEKNPKDAYAWFNLGTNLVYFERYGEAGDAFDTALGLGLPWRFTRYQFGPYIAYFNQGRFQDVINLADATLYRTYKAEESHLWRGWAEYRLGETSAAIADFKDALSINPNYQDAQYALKFVTGG
jgi:tetratricopeptide (TPR) repeat protein